MEVRQNALAAPRASARNEQEQAPGAMGRDDFMKLLVTQLQNQDPLDPMKAEQMVSQLSELTSVEELVAIEGRMQALEVGIASVANTQVSGLVGKTVRADGTSLILDGSGPVESSFTLEGPAEEVTVTIRDAGGNAVRTMTLDPSMAGEVNFTWDGLDDNGQPLGEGRYRMEITAKAENGQSVGVDTDIRGLVTEVSYDDGFPQLVVGDRRVVLGDVRAIEM